MPASKPPPADPQPAPSVQPPVLPEPVLGSTPIPNLGHVVTAADVSTKGTGSYAADYVNWCRITQLLRDHAPGWLFHLRPTAEGQHVWAAPNGTGYVVGYFEGPGDTITPDFPQAVMDNRNAPVLLERISARDLTDTHRRALCTCAAATFGLAWQLWAREPLEDPHQRREEAPAAVAPGPRRQERTPAQLAEAAIEAVRHSDLTQDGMRTLLLQFGDGKTTAIGQLPVAALRSIPKLMQYPGKVSLLNRGLHTATEQPLLAAAEAAQREQDSELADEAEPPMTWAA